MDVRDIVTRYYEYANAGEWDAWCDLFAEDQVMDEQLAGHIEGLPTLREMMKGFGGMYASFSNAPRHILVDGDEAAVVSHISAVTPAGAGIEAEVVNYFRLRDGRIAYMANFHDTVPFQVLRGSDA
jgi:ketosteroid isomerase-like protein